MSGSAVTRRARRGLLREWRLHAVSVFALAVAFLCLGAALLALVNLRALEERWGRAGLASVYLKDSASQAEVDAIEGALRRVPAVSSVRYVSSGQARAEVAAAGDGPLASLPAEAFPASLELHFQGDVAPADVDAVVEKLRMLPAVDDVETYQAWTARLGRLVRGSVAAAGLLCFVVLAAVLAVVGSTVRLALQRRRVEVEVLRLVGATDSFVRGPFVVEGTLQGAAGALGALGLLLAVFTLVRARLDAELLALVGFEPSFLPWFAAVGLVVAGGALGALAAVVSLRRLTAV